MIDRRFFVSELTACGLSVAILPTAFSSKSCAGTLAALDKDNDGTLDLAEVKAAAASVFDKLDKDSDATLDSKEIAGRARRQDTVQPGRPGSRRNLDEGRISWPCRKALQRRRCRQGWNPYREGPQVKGGARARALDANVTRKKFSAMPMK